MELCKPQGTARSNQKVRPVGSIWALRAGYYHPEDLQNQLGPKELEALAGSLCILAARTAEMAQGVQTNGKPRNLAEERWILELADIYENAFCRPATVSGSGDEPTRRRGKFFRLLQLSRPLSFPRHGNLSLKHIKQVLAQRKKTEIFIG